MTSEQDSTRVNRPSAVRRFMRNFASIWKEVGKSLGGIVLKLIVAFVGLVLINIWIFTPILVYQAYFYGFDSIFTGADVFTTKDNVIVISITIVWVALWITGGVAGYKTYKGDSSE